MTINIGANIRLNKVGLCVSTVFLIFLYLFAIRESSFWKSKPNNKDFISLKSLLAASIRAAELGGSEIINLHGGTKIAVEKKGKTKEGIEDLVTTADYRSHCAMYTYLKNNFARVNIISEETSVRCDDEITRASKNVGVLSDYVPNEYDVHVDAQDVTVWIDPLDATKEFTDLVIVEQIALFGRVVPVEFQLGEPYWKERQYMKHIMTLRLAYREIGTTRPQ